MPDTKRKLAAILAADVAGYSRLMGADEDGTVAALDACRAIFRGAIKSHDGRVVDTAGDSVLATFDSVVEAVRCAVAIQGALAERDADLPDDRRMRFRIGVNLGDVIAKGDGTIYGDGVNVAARLEALAEPGGICLSGSAHDQVEGKIELGFEDIGTQAVKNIARPVRAYRVSIESTGVETPTGPDKPLPLPDKPSIAVLAFDNLSGDPEQEYFTDGISEDIITDISKVSGLFVTARNSSFAYRGRTANIGTVCSELGVRYILEGSVRKASGRVRITAQLIDGKTGGHLWAERYDRQLDDIFAVQDEVTQKIVAALKVHLTETEREALTYRGTSNLDAYDFNLRAREAYNKFTSQGNVDARAWLDKALALDPRFPHAVALLAETHTTDYVNQWSEDWEKSRRMGRQLALKAVSIDDRCAYAHAHLGTAQLWSGEPDRAINEMEQAIALDPNFAAGYLVLGTALHYVGDSRTALTHLATAKRLDPYRPNFILHYEALCHFMLGDYQCSAEVLRDRIDRFPETDISRALLASAYGHLGKMDEAQATWSALMEVNPDYSFAQRRKILPYRNPDDPERIAEGLREAGLDIPDEPTATD